MTNHTELIAQLQQTNQFHDNADVTTAQIVDAIESLEAERDGLKETLESTLQILKKRDEQLAAAQGQVDEQRGYKDDAYLERNRLVALLSKVFPSGKKKTAIEGWSEDWHGCVYIDLPTGQASWHYHDSQSWLFEHLPEYQGTWDGHATDKKYERIQGYAAPIPQQPAEPVNAMLLEALKFYADKDHFMLGDPDAWDTVSGEPQNFWCDEEGTATVEDGSVARAAIAAIEQAQLVPEGFIKFTGVDDYEGQSSQQAQPNTAAVLPDGSVATNVYEAFEAGKQAQPEPAWSPLTVDEAEALTAMVYGAPWDRNYCEGLLDVLAMYDDLRFTGKRPVDPATLPPINMCENCAMDLEHCDCVDSKPVAVKRDPSKQAQPERVPLTMEQCKAKFEAWYASAPDAEPEPDRTYELSDESMSELTKDCIWLGWQAAHGIKQGGQQ
jgi:hypothetical protein